MRKFGLVLFLFIIILSSCENINQVEDFPKYNVVCLLSNLESFQKVYIFKAFGTSERNTFYNVPEPGDARYRDFIDNYVVKDARVSIVSSEGIINFGYGVVDSLCYSEKGEKLKIIPGEIYKLNVETSSGEIIKGETKVPKGIKILKPSYGDTVKAFGIYQDWYQVNVKLRWSRSENASGYLVSIAGFRQYFYFVTDTVISVNYDFRGYVKELKLKVMAVDENFYKHVFYGIDMAGLRGAFGVFASGMGDSTMITVTF